MLDDNGKKEELPVKTPEQLASERFSRYQKDPESFTENGELVVAVKRNPKGLMYFINGSEQELNYVWAELNRRIMNILNMIEIQKKEGGIIKPQPHGILNFVRRKVGG